MSNAFNYKIYVPSHKDYINFKELKCRSYKNILKFIQNDDNTGLSSYIDKIIHELCEPGPDIKGLDRLDKICILLNIRILSINPNLELVFNNDNDQATFTNTINLNSLLNTLTNIEFSTTGTHEVHGIKVNFCIPSSLYYEDTFNIYEECIRSISINNKTFNFTNLTSLEKKNIIDSLPGEFLFAIQEYIEDNFEKFNEISYFKLMTPTEEGPKEDNYTFNMYNNTYFDFVKLLFGRNLKNYYDTCYHLCTKLSMSLEYVENELTPAESMLYCTLFTEEVKKQREEMQKQQKNSSNVTDLNLPTPLQ